MTLVISKSQRKTVLEGSSQRQRLSISEPPSCLEVKVSAESGLFLIAYSSATFSIIVFKMWVWRACISRTGGEK